MADLKSGTTVGGQLVLTQDVFPLDVIGDSLKFKGLKVYTELEPPRADEVDAVSRSNGGTFLKPVKVVGNLSIDSVSSPGSGLNLISGESAGEPNFGVFHGYTPDFGKHGAVQSNWATYFTNRGNANYGWIFKTSAGAVASVGSTGIITAPSYVSSGVAPTAPDQLTRKDYVDAVNTNLTNAVNLKVAKSGDTMTGPLTAPSFNGNLTGDVVGNISGNAGSATKLQTARTIGGVSFNGTANINLPGVNTAGNQSTSGNAATATKLATARAINGVSFDGTKDINISLVTNPMSADQLISSINMQNSVWDKAASPIPADSPHTDAIKVLNIGNPSWNTQFVLPAYDNNMYIRSRIASNGAFRAWRQFAFTDSNITGNAASATKLQTARTIGGVSFDGSANINLPGVNTAGNQSTSGNAATATTLQTARTIAISGAVTGTATSFNGSANIAIATTAIDGSKISTGTIPAARIPTLNQSTTGNAASATKLATARTLSWTGDATGSLSFDGTANASTDLTLANSGVTAGTYKSVTVDAKGRVTAGNDVVTGLITSTAATGTANVATTNTNTFLNITEKTGSATSTVGSSSQITGAGTVTVASDAAGKITITGAQTITGNAASATKLATARTINGVNFDGTANITVADSTKLPLAGGTLAGNLSVTGTITATGNITAFSDARIKGDLLEIEDSVSKVQSLTGYTYTRTDLNDGLRYVGLIAQDVQAVIPEAVRENTDGTLSVDYMGLVGLLVQSIKELDKRIKDLEGA